MTIINILSLHLSSSPIEINVKRVLMLLHDVFACSPAYGIPQILDKVGMAASDIDAYEVHEAFAVSLCFVPSSY